MDANGDWTFGGSAGGKYFTGPTQQANFYVDSPAAVGQAIVTRLGLFEGEWFIDTTVGTPYFEAIIGKYTQATADNALRSRINGTQGVAQIKQYASELANRELTVQAAVATIYSATELVLLAGIFSAARLNFTFTLGSSLLK